MKITHITAEPKHQIETNRHGVKVAGMAYNWYTNQQYDTEQDNNK